MKKIILALFILCFISVTSQTEKYSRVAIKGESGQLRSRLAQIGVVFDHARYTKNEIIAELSSTEIAQIKQNNFQVDILIDDVSAYYVERNLQAQRTETVASCNVPHVTKPAHFHLGGMGGYYTLVQMEAILDSMALLYPNLITVKHPIATTQSLEGRNIWYVKISDNPGTDENEPEVLYDAVHHAREPQSMSQLIFYMWHLLENYPTDPEVKGLVDNTEMFFVPCVNPDGYVYNQTTNPGGGGMWRKNRRHNSDGTFGVDLNRNYGFNWGYDNIGSVPTPSNDVYRGTAAFSEPETQAMRDFCISRHFEAALNYHTFGNDLIYPWGYIASLLTPDSTQFANWGAYLTETNRYAHGTGDQTVNYVTNGDSDDWMYGEQTTKPKMFIFTPETGSNYDGFWPPSTRIIDNCKFTLEENLNLARLVLPCFEPIEKTDRFIHASGYARYDLLRLGLAQGSATVSFHALGSTISGFGAPKVYSSMTMNQLLTDSISFTLAPALLPGQHISYIMKVEDGIRTQYDTLTKIFGTPTVLFYEDGTSVANSFDVSGTPWDLDNTTFVSPPSCIVDGHGHYNSNEDKTIVINQQADLTNAIYAHLQYYIKYDIEKEFDMAQVLISTNNGANFSPLCAPRSTSPLSFNATDPVYDGRQDTWLKEEIDLSAYIGQNILIAFNLTSDAYLEKEGIYLDDILIRKLAGSSVGIANQQNTAGPVNVFPNPGSGLFQLSSSASETTQLDIYNATGGHVSVTSIPANTSAQLDMSAQPGGMYLLRFKTGGAEFTKKLILEK